MRYLKKIKPGTKKKLIGACTVPGVFAHIYCCQKLFTNKLNSIDP